MKPTSLALASLALLSSLALAGAAQRKVIYKDRKGDVSVLANSGSGELQAPDFKTVKFTVVGNVEVASRAQGMGMTAARMTGVVEPDPARKGSQRLDELRASGGVTILRTRTETVKGSPVSGTTDVKSNVATYKTGAGDSGTATLDGNVVIVDTLGARKVNLLGNDGTANFSTAVKGNSALKGATVVGNVRIKVTQVDSAGVARQYNASGDRLEYANNGDTGTLTLTGDVKLDSPGEDGGDVEGVRRAVLTLNAKGELSRVQFSTDDPAKKVRTVYRPKKSPAKPARKGN